IQGWTPPTKRLSPTTTIKATTAATTARRAAIADLDRASSHSPIEAGCSFDTAPIVAATPDPADAALVVGGRTPSRTRPKSTGKNTSRFPNTSPIAHGNTSGATATATSATTFGATPAAYRAASDRATRPRPATAG